MCACRVMTPEAVQLQTVEFDDPNLLTVRAALDGEVVMAILANEPAHPQPTPLPMLTLAAHVDPTFHVSLPVGIQVSSINAAVQRI